MAVEEAKRLGLEVSKEGEWWWISPSFLWMTVLGMEFLDKVKAFPIPFANTMCIVEEGTSCMVPVVRQAKPFESLEIGVQDFVSTTAL